jgi:hypothetical protein
MRCLLVLAVAATSLTALLAPASAVGASAEAPGWQIDAVSMPTNFAPGSSDDSYQVFVKNSGSEPSSGPVTITDELPPGLTASGVQAERRSQRFESGIGGGIGEESPLSCQVSSDRTAVTCLYETGAPPVKPGVVIEMAVAVAVAPERQAGVQWLEGEQVPDLAEVSGGGAPSESTSAETTISAKQAPFGVASFAFDMAGSDGLIDTQAGDHPYESTVSLFLDTEAAAGNEFINGQGGRIIYLPVSNDRGVREEVKDLVFELPPGLVGDPQAVGKCTPSRVSNDTCPLSDQIGFAELYIIPKAGGDVNQVGTYPFWAPIYNVTPEPGEPADFELKANGLPVNIAVTVSHESDYRVRVTIAGIPREAEFDGAVTTFFGTPLTDRNYENANVGGQPLAFLQNPVDCSAGPQSASVYMDSWQNPGAWLSGGSPDFSDPRWLRTTKTVYPALSGCEMLGFQPSVALTPDTSQADEPTGVTVDLDVPQSPDRFPALATPELRDATVTLPAGMSLSPSAGDGLQGCSDEQFAEDSTAASGCPNGSVLGTVRVFTPLLEAPLSGQIFLGEPECDPCTSVDAADGKQLRLFLEAYGSGVRVKKEGRVYANPTTGQLTSAFVDNPQLPFERLELRFKGGQRAGLATPQACGPASTTADLTPWSSPITPDATSVESFDVSRNGEGGPCPSTLPLAPSFGAGTSDPDAGQFSPFTLSFGREDREQDLTAIQVQMPSGLLGTLNGVPLCGEPEANSGACPASSRIGALTVAAGPGPHPFYERGTIYITEAYGGAPFGLSIVVPTVAGPFNLGNVLVRAKINVDPDTAALTITSDPLPQIIDGVPLRLRKVNVTIDRAGFILNPTDCEQLHLTATIAGAEGAHADVSVPFAVAGCAGLHFAPTFVVSTSAHTSRTDGASLDARLTFPTGPQSNVSRVKVELPKQLPSRLTTLQKGCPAALFAANPGACPVASLVGVARASTPILPVALRGPAYFVTHGGAKFPELVVVLQGYGVRVDLHGETFINKAGVTSSTFSGVPDVPVSSFELYLPEGPHSALAAVGDLCSRTVGQKRHSKGSGRRVPVSLRMPTSITAQDGARLEQDTKIKVVGCAAGKGARTTSKRTVGRAR